jgi:hypothetical protein
MAIRRMACCVIQAAASRATQFLQNGSSDNILTPEQAGVVLSSRTLLASM